MEFITGERGEVSSVASTSVRLSFQSRFRRRVRSPRATSTMVSAVAGTQDGTVALDRRRKPQPTSRQRPTDGRYRIRSAFATPIAKNRLLTGRIVTKNHAVENWTSQSFRNFVANSAPIATHVAIESITIGSNGERAIGTSVVQ